jgi:hypothetical protein
MTCNYDQQLANYATMTLNYAMLCIVFDAQKFVCAHRERVSLSTCKEPLRENIRQPNIVFFLQSTKILNIIINKYCTNLTCNVAFLHVRKVQKFFATFLQSTFLMICHKFGGRLKCLITGL